VDTLLLGTGSLYSEFPWKQAKFQDPGTVYRLFSACYMGNNTWQCDTVVFLQIYNRSCENVDVKDLAVLISLKNLADSGILRHNRKKLFLLAILDLGMDSRCHFKLCDIDISRETTCLTDGEI
jgi:hypothetical protein